jgi:hypothetical protein
MKDISLKAKQDENGDIWVLFPLTESKVSYSYKIKKLSPETGEIAEVIRSSILKSDIYGKLSCTEVAEIIGINKYNRSDLNKIAHALKLLGYKSGRNNKKRYFTIE